VSTLKSIKQKLLSSAKFCGAFNLLGNSSWRQNRLLIIGYHGISLDDEHVWNPELFIPARVLRQRFELIRKNGCTVLSLSEGLSRLYEGSLPPRSVVLTFDDGSYDFYEKALPILQEFGFPATLYLTTYYVTDHKPVFGVAAGYLLWKGKSGRLDLEKLLGDGDVSLLSSDEDRIRVHSFIVEHAERLKLSAEAKNNLLQAICKQLDIDFDVFSSSRILQLMNCKEIDLIAKAGIDVQLHTHRHRVPIDEKLFNREIADNRQVIKAITGQSPVHFCYPSGKYHPDFFPWLKKADVISATTCDAALSHRESNPYLLSRLIDTSSLSDVEFEGWVVGASHFLPQRRG
jgi:peptidoglycan/xylan/chitin deacetylase (PgdA/CDA1 family)